MVGEAVSFCCDRDCSRQLYGIQAAEAAASATIEMLRAAGWRGLAGLLTRGSRV